MAITHSRHGDVTLLSVQGELSGSAAQEFQNIVAAEMARDHRDFCVDFGQAIGVDSRGLEALTALKRACEERLGRVKVCGLNATLATVFRITRLDRAFECLTDAATTVASFG